MINDKVVDFGYLSINHVGEELCGDNVAISNVNDNNRIFVLADGLGSGVKANILSKLTSKMMSTMLSNNIDINECVKTIISTLPVCKERKVAYSTFTVIQVLDSKFAKIYNYDNPDPFLIKDNKAVDLDFTSTKIDNRIIKKCEVELDENDSIFMMSDGAIHAGVGQILNYGWERPQIMEFMQNAFSNEISAKSLATILIDRCNGLYLNQPGDDTTAAVVKIKKRKQINLMVGPATNKEDDEKMNSLFFAKSGKHIVCGGTTSSIVAKYLNEKIDMTTDYIDSQVPPISYIKGVDLVTEGVVTLNKVLEYGENYLADNSEYFNWNFKSDGASLIASMLFEEASDIDFFVGCAINPAHQDAQGPINFSLKMQLIEKLINVLKTMGKNIKVTYY